MLFYTGTGEEEFIGNIVGIDPDIEDGVNLGEWIALDNGDEEYLFGGDLAYTIVCPD